ncbi:MAG TPA: ABC-type transport auxiliary lipoprotein family protein [Beijerinckiaceae bacterium]|jgi:cholesterol transport system auxiliary component
MMRSLFPPRRVLLAGLGAALLAACSSGPSPTTFDLSAPSQKVRGGSVRGQVVVAEPVTVQTFEADRIIVKDPSGAVSFLGGGQWADRLPRLVQARLVQTFENASRLKAVSRPGERITADFQLNTEIRAFNIDSATGEALVEISAKVVDDRTGRITTARVFSARVPVGAVEAGAAARALDQALSQVLLGIVRFVGA